MGSLRFSNIKFVVLDRDGVINEKAPEGQYITRSEDLKLLPGAAAAIRKLNQTGRTVVVVTNQRGIALGLMTEEDLMSVHQHLYEMLAEQGAHLDSLYYCPHDRAGCNCRKPAIGMIEAARRDFPDASASNANGLLIGDSLSDIQTARNAGMRSVLIIGGENHAKPGREEAAKLADGTAGSLLEAVGYLGDE